MIRWLPLLMPLMLSGAETSTYYVGFLRAGPNAAAIAGDELKLLQQAHMSHIQRMAETGALVGAGPAIGSPTLRGLFIFKTDSLAQARTLAEADPAVKAGRMAVEMYEWTGPAGLSEEYRARKRADPQTPDKMLRVQLVLFKRGPRGEAARQMPDGILSRALAHGPFAGDQEYFGMAVLTLASVEEARKLVESDRSLPSSGLTAEVHPWMVADGVFPIKR